MIDYGLVKELKEAGYDQTVNSERFESHYYKGELSPKTIDFRGLEILGEDTVLIPTLSELIEACGDEFNELHKLPRHPWKTASIDNLFGEGKTPEEAVARLWLKLNDTNKRKNIS